MNIKNLGPFFRITYNNIGIYEALKQNITLNEWKILLQSESINWLPKPNIYTNNNLSYFTANGYTKFCNKTLPIIKIYLKNIIYYDKYQVITENINLD